MLLKSILSEFEIAAERDSRWERCDYFTSVMSPERMCDLQTNRKRAESEQFVLSCQSSLMEGKQCPRVTCDKYHTILRVCPQEKECLSTWCMWTVLTLNMDEVLVAKRGANNKTDKVGLRCEYSSVIFFAWATKFPFPIFFPQGLDHHHISTHSCCY